MLKNARERFDEDGFLAPVKFLDKGEIEFYQSKYRNYEKLYGSGGKDNQRRIRGNRIFRIHMVARWAAELVRHPKLISMIQEVLDTEDILIWSSDLAIKTANSTQCFGWHQDEAYAHLGPANKLLTAWIALTDSNVDNGCVKYIRGSHKLGKLSHKSQLRTQNENLVLGQVIADDLIIQRLEHSILNCELKAGEASLHAWRTVHSSKPNKSDQERIGLAVRYMAGNVTPYNTVVKELVTLAAGQYTGDYFEIEDVPVGEYGKEEWTLHKRSMDREWERRKKSKELGLLPSHKFKSNENNCDQESTN